MKMDIQPGDIPPRARPRDPAGEGLAGTNPYRAHKFGSQRNRSTRALSYALTLVGVSVIAFLVALLLIWYTATAP